MKIFGAEPLRKYPGNLRVLLESSGRRKSGKSSSEVAPSKPSSVPNHTQKNNKNKNVCYFYLTGCCCCFHTVRRMGYYYGKGVDWLLYSITATFAVKKEKRIETFFPISQLNRKKHTIE